MEYDVQLLSHEDVVAMYEVLLGRKPESHEVVDRWRALGSAAAALRLIGQSAEYAQRARSSPFYHYHASFDAEETIRSHAVAGLTPRDGCLTNFLGVVLDCKLVPEILHERAGQVEGLPIPANWHADIAEWGAVLRAVDLAQQTFTMAELGCGWGCWMNNSGTAARRRGLKTLLIGVEGDKGHLSFARQTCAMNGFGHDELQLVHGIAATKAGTALFPRQRTSGLKWGLEPIFDADENQRLQVLEAGTHDELPMISLDAIIGDSPALDLLHIDIQGGEAELVENCMEILNSRVRYMVIGTHSRNIEARIMERLQTAGWTMEIERPAILRLSDGSPVTVVDGVQGWRNTTARLARSSLEA